jgi:hypothetical protein
MGSSERSLSQDTVFDILSNPRRRYVLYYLRQEGGPVQLTRLAEHVAAWENETEVESLDDQQRKRVYVSLYQTHVPKLADAGVVEYDKDQGSVALAEDAVAIDDYLSRQDDELPWQYVYAAEAAVGVVLLALTFFDAPVFGALPDTLVSFLIVLTFAVTVGAQFLLRGRRRTVPPELRRR